MSAEDRLAARFAAERKKQNKQVRYPLAEIPFRFRFVYFGFIPTK